jgi:hypothetical protein
LQPVFACPLIRLFVDLHVPGRGCLLFVCLLSSFLVSFAFSAVARHQVLAQSVPILGCLASPVLDCPGARTVPALDRSGAFLRLVYAACSTSLVLGVRPSGVSGIQRSPPIGVSGT